MHQLLRILARAAAIVVITCLFPAKCMRASYANAVRWNAAASLFFSHDDLKNSGGSTGIVVGGWTRRHAGMGR
jgi:hypothetical protein